MKITLILSILLGISGINSSAQAQSPLVTLSAPSESTQSLLRNGRENAKRGNHQEAISNYNQAIQVNPRYTAVYISGDCLSL